MATGDNILTAVSVARQCSILDEGKEVWMADMVESADGLKLQWKSTKSD